MRQPCPGISMRHTPCDNESTVHATQGCRKGPHLDGLKEDNEGKPRQRASGHCTHTHIVGASRARSKRAAAVLGYAIGPSCGRVVTCDSTVGTPRKGDARPGGNCIGASQAHGGKVKRRARLPEIDARLACDVSPETDRGGRAPWTQPHCTPGGRSTQMIARRARRLHDHRRHR